MRLALSAALTAAALVTPFVACGGDDGGTITDPGTWLDTYVTKLCTKAHECKAMFLTPERVRTSVSSGKVTFDASKGSQCLAMLPYDTQTCPAFWAGTDPDACTGVLTGTVALNGACANSLECTTGLSCAQNVCSSPGVTGPGAARSNLNAALAGN